VLDEKPSTFGTTPVQILFYNRKRFSLSSIRVARRAAKGVMVSHANNPGEFSTLQLWMRYREGGVYLHAAPIFHIAISRHVRSTGFVPAKSRFKVQPARFL